VISGLSLGDLRGLLRDLRAGGLAGADQVEHMPRPSRRRPRRGDVVTYRVRVDLAGTKPPLWRRLELASDLFLGEVHEVLQAAFGWTDSHLHRFGSGPEYYGDDTEYYLCAFDVDEGQPGVPEGQVRLDEVLADADDKLWYVYDFGDDWRHILELEAVLSRDGSAPRAVCTGGRRAGPAEDCGGVHGYELIAAATDPANPDHADAAFELSRFFGDIDAAAVAPIPCNIDETNSMLADLGRDGVSPGVDLPEPLADLVDAVRTSTERRRLRRLIGDAAFNEPATVTEETAARMVRPYAWLLNHVGVAGIRLTGAGYLPPVHVEAAMAALNLGEEWIGKGNREIQTLPVLHLRESAQAMGLLRKHRGTLLLTARGRALSTDPVALWWQLAERVPVRSKDAAETQAGLILLAAVAAGASDSDTIIAEILNAIGWRNAEGAPLTGSMAARAAWNTRAVLRRLGCFADDRHTYRNTPPTPDGVTFARAALRTWPGKTRTGTPPSK
jgi:hypothetical protein